MPKQVSPLVGFNNNVKHNGRIFHVQTEDSGVNRPRIVTHLFADGGRIIKSTKTDYAEHVGRKDMVAVVRRMMKEQHKAMFIALRDGQFNDLIDGTALPDDDKKMGDEQPADATPLATGEPATPARRLSDPPPKPARRRGRIPTIPDMEQPAAVAASGTPAESPGPIPRRPAPTMTDFSLADVGAPAAEPTSGTVAAEALAAAERQGDGPAQPTGKLPPRGTPVLGTPAVSSDPPPSTRYGAPRPPAIFQEGEESSSIFGGQSISEQSLDEVILSYLAEDLDEAPPEGT